MSVSLIKKGWDLFQRSWWFGHKGTFYLFLLGAVVALTFALCTIAVPRLGIVSERLVLLVGFAGFFLYGGRRRLGVPVWLLLAAVAVVLLSWGLAHLSHPEWAERSPKVERLASWFGFIALAWLLSGQTRWTLMIWGVALLGLLLAPWVLGNGLDEWRRGLSGRRVDFGMGNAQHTSMLFAIALLGLLAMAGRILAPGPAAWCRRLLWAAALLSTLLAVLVSQSRGVWVGLLFAFLVLAGCVLRAGLSRSADRKRLRLLLMVMAAGILLLVPLVWQFGGIIESRVEREQEVVLAMISGESLDSVKKGSVGDRLHMWQAGVDWIKQRPLVGWGGNGRTLVFSHSTVLPEWLHQSYNHLHNSYLDTLANYGLLGLMVMLWLYAWVTVRAIQAWRRGYLPGDMLSFYLAFLSLWLIANLFESYMYSTIASTVLMLVLGGVVTHVWAMQRAEESREQAPLAGSRA